MCVTLLFCMQACAVQYSLLIRALVDALCRMARVECHVIRLHKSLNLR